MLQISCPFCGKRDHSEFKYGGAAVKYPAIDASTEEWHNAVFMRDNVRGLQEETWHHVHGCRMWLIVTRDTMTHEIKTVRPADTSLDDIIQVETSFNLEDDDWLDDDEETDIPQNDVDSSKDDSNTTSMKEDNNES